MTHERNEWRSYAGALGACVAAILIVRGACWLLDPQLRFYTDTASYLAVAKTWADGFPDYAVQDRAVGFSGLWVPFLQSSRVDLWIVGTNAVLATAAGAALFTALAVCRVRPWLAAAGTVMVVSLPAALFYDRVLLSEASGFAAVLVMTALLLIGMQTRPRIALPMLALFGFVSAFSAQAVRGSLWGVCLGGLAALVIIAGAHAFRRRNLDGSAAMRLCGVLCVIVGVAVGSGVVGYLDNPADPGAVARNSRAMSPFLLIAKLGPAVDCAPDALARSDPEGTRSALCLQIAQMPPASISYDGVFWQAPVYAAWTAPDYAERGAAWRELAIDTVRHRPLAAARVLMRDAVALVIHPNLEALPTQPPTDWAAYVVARSALPRYAPEPPRRFAAVLPVGNEAQSRLRGAILVVIACAIALSLRHRSRQRTSAIAMLLAWFGAVAFLLLVVPPQARYLATLDPLLGAAAVLAVATLRPRPRQAATSPVSSISAAS